MLIIFITKENLYGYFKGVKKVPGGLMVVPLLLGAFINTFSLKF